MPMNIDSEYSTRHHEIANILGVHIFYSREGGFTTMQFKKKDHYHEGVRSDSRSIEVESYSEEA